MFREHLLRLRLRLGLLEDFERQVVSLNVIPSHAPVIMDGRVVSPAGTPGKRIVAITLYTEKRP